MENDIDISGIDKAALLAALYNGSFQAGMGIMHAAGRKDMTVEDARKIIAGEGGLLPWENDDAKKLYFDYVHGRVLKVNLSGDVLRPFGYDRDVGKGAAARVVAQLRAAKSAAA